MKCATRYLFVLTLGSILAILSACDGSPLGGGGAGAPRILTPGVTNAIVGAEYSYMLMGSGGVQPYRWSISAGALPAGLVLGEVGAPGTTIQGRCTAPGTSSFSVRLQDAAGKTAERGYTIVVSVLPLTITQSAVDDAGEGDAYTTRLTAGGGLEPYQWSIASGALPAGLSIENSGHDTTYITGTPAAAGQYPFRVAVSDGTGQSFERNYSLRVYPPLVLTSPLMGIELLGQAHQFNLTATGGAGAYVFSVASGGFAGLNVRPDGLVQCSPEVTGEFDVIMRVTDWRLTTATTVVHFTVSRLLEITTTQLPRAYPGVAYLADIAAVGGVDTAYTWAIAGGSLPPGLELFGAVPAATLVGTPTVAGTYLFRVRVTDALGLTAHRDYSMEIWQPLRILTTMLPHPTQGADYTAHVVAEGGKPGAMSWSVVAGALPGGMSVVGAGLAADVTGMSMVQGSFNFTLRVSDSTGEVADAPYSFTVQPATLPEIVINEYWPYYMLPDAVAGEAYYATIKCRNGAGTQRTWRVVSGLEGWLAFSDNGGDTATITGSPTPMTYSTWFTIEVTDMLGQSARATARLAVRIAFGNFLFLSPVASTNTLSLCRGTVGSPYISYLSAYGGTWRGFSYSITSGVLPRGLSVAGDTSIGRIEGTPEEAGTFPIRVTVMDSAGNQGHKDLTLVVEDTATLLRPMSPNYPVVIIEYFGNGNSLDVYPFHWLLWVEGGNGQGITWQIESGTLPPGVSLDNSSTHMGGLRGELPFITPYGTWDFVVRITDMAGGVALQPVSIRFFPPGPLPGG